MQCGPSFGSTALSKHLKKLQLACLFLSPFFELTCRNNVNGRSAASQHVAADQHKCIGRVVADLLVDGTGQLRDYLASAPYAIMRKSARGLKAGAKTPLVVSVPGVVSKSQTSIIWT